MCRPKGASSHDGIRRRLNSECKNSSLARPWTKRAFFQSNKSLPYRAALCRPPASAALFLPRVTSLIHFFSYAAKLIFIRVPLIFVYSCSTYLSSIRCLLFPGMHCWLRKSKKGLQWIFRFEADEHISKQGLNAFRNFVLHPLQIQFRCAICLHYIAGCTSQREVARQWKSQMLTQCEVKLGGKAILLRNVRAILMKRWIFIEISDTRGNSQHQINAASFHFASFYVHIHSSLPSSLEEDLRLNK